MLAIKPITSAQRASGRRARPNVKWNSLDLPAGNLNLLLGILRRRHINQLASYQVGIRRPELNVDMIDYNPVAYPRFRSAEQNMLRYRMHMIYTYNNTVRGRG